MTLTLSDVVYKYDIDTDIVTNKIIIIDTFATFFLSLFNFLWVFFFSEKLKTKYESCLISLHLKVLLRMPLFWLTNLLIDYNLTQDELLNYLIIDVFFYKCNINT